MESDCVDADGPAETECSICKSDFQDPARPASCRHVFCRSCLTQSLQMRPHCPLCRTPASELLIVPVTDLLAPAEPTADPQRVRLGRVRDRLQRHGTLLPVMDPFATVSTRRLSGTMQERLRRLAESVEASQSELPTAPQDPPTPLILPALANRIPPFRPRPTPRPRRSYGVIQPSAQIPAVTPLSNAAPSTAPLWPPAPPAQPDSGGAMGFPPPDFPSAPSLYGEFLDDILHEIQMWELGGHRELTLTFTCPYCQESGLDELGLRDHCNTNHRADTRRVVCPICVSLPHGDPTYQSVDFIGHVNRRHNYYNADFMDMSLDDSITQQAAILASYNSLVQK